jgi:protein ImuA
VSAAALESLAAIPGVWRGVGHKRSDVESTGNPELDSALLGGWPVGALTQIVSRETGLGFSLLVPLFTRMTRSRKSVALIAPPYIPYAPGLLERGVLLQNLIWIQPKNHSEALWTAEQILRSGVFGAVALWSLPLGMTPERRLQLAAQTGHSIAVVCHATDAALHSVAAVRLAVSSAPGALLITVERCRGSSPRKRLRQPLPLSRAA